MRDLKSMTFDELAGVVTACGEKPFRAQQLFEWMGKGVDDFDEITNLPAAMLDKMKQSYYVSYVKIEKKLVSRLDGTVKYLYRLRDGEYIESVVMHYKHGYSICISTQAGCNMGCTFCASTRGGKHRDLTAGEMLSQIYTAQKDLCIRVSNVVLMGMGEPLDNYEQTVRFLQLVGCEQGLHIGMRHISLSTCGLVDQIQKLQTLRLQITLSISLHAPNDTIRRQLMPVAKKWSIQQLIDACKAYIDETGRRISFEYAVVKDVNDSDACAMELAELLKGMLCHINLIPVNQIENGVCMRPDMNRVHRFETLLQQRGLNTTIRRTLGADIAASCGQLRGNR